MFVITINLVWTPNLLIFIQQLTRWHFSCHKEISISESKLPHHSQSVYLSQPGVVPELFYHERDLEVKEGVLSALDYAHDPWYSSPIWDEEERFDLS